MRVPKAPLIGKSTTVRAATDHDADLLVAWHADPEVARYWGHTTYTHEVMLTKLARPGVDPYIIQERGEPVGYLQAWFEDDEPDSGGLDMFLIPGARGRGLGPDAANTLARWLTEVGGIRHLITDPYLWNDVAMRAWSKAGFRFVEIREPDGERTAPCALMVFEVDDAARKERYPWKSR